MEEWIDIKDYEGIYQVSSLGRVRGVDRKKSDGNFQRGCILSQHNIQGYYRVQLRKKGTKKLVSVHRLVAFAFVSGYKQGLIVNHIDENKHNNRASNLEWVTYKQNIQHSIHKWINRGGKIVGQYSLQGEFIRKFPSVAEAGRQTGIHYSNIITSMKDAHRTQAGGFVWKYI